MSFASLEFLIFFALLVPSYFLVPGSWRWLLLLIASYLFYAWWNVSYIILIVFSTVVDYLAAAAMPAPDSGQDGRRRLLLMLSLVVNLGVLFTFKYFNFMSESVGLVLGSLGVAYDHQALDMLLPVGISFYTFQSMAYTIDVYRGRLAPERHFGIFALYVAFFPQLVAGPIERAQNILPQLRQQFSFDYGRVVQGLRLILWGMFKKVVIADRVAVYVNAVYGDPQRYDGGVLLLATLLFAVQIYCDFSGYTDIAIGTARIMGFRLMDNFRQPYFATSISDFWRRWHISLSTWFRDYLYIPLGGSRVPLPRYLGNLMIVFVVSGLWHGAAWTFVIWGALHGLYMVAEVALRRSGLQLIPGPAWLRMALGGLVTFALTSFAWIFFRANSPADAFYIAGHLLSFSGGDILAPLAGSVLATRGELFIALAAIAVLLVVDGLSARIISTTQHLPDQLALVPRWLLYYGIAGFILIAATLYARATSPFIYFQF